MRGAPQTARQASCPELGLERVSWVRIVVGPDGARCEVAGVAHRRPVVRTLPLRTATALIAAGVPAVVRSRSRGDTSSVRPGAGSLAGDRG